MNKKKKDKKIFDGFNIQDHARAKQNMLEMNKPRKNPAKSFKAQFDSGECPKCFKTILQGETVRYVDNVLTHTFHKHEEPTYEVCDRCFLTLPCECEQG